MPQALRDYAGLTKDVMLMGIFKQFEIWDKGAWQAREVPDHVEDISRTLEDLGI